MKAVADHGWRIGLRFDPLIYHPEFEIIYKKLIDDIFRFVSKESLHSISIGPLRFPDKMYQKIIKLYPKDQLLTHPFYRRGNIFSYKIEIENAMKACVKRLLENYVDETLLFEYDTQDG
jgi:spore photoproduct lyase